LQEQIDGVRL